MPKKLVSFKFNLVIISTFILLNACSNNNSATTGNQTINKPGSPKKIFASYENNKSILTWDAPDSTATVNYYQIERSLLDKNIFNKISPQLPATQLTFTDPIINRKFGDSFEYRVLAGYSTSTKISEVSNVITPGPALNTSHNRSDFFSSSYAWENSRFGFKIAFNADGSSIAVASKESIKDSGGLIIAVEIFKQDKANKWSMVSSVTAP